MIGILLKHTYASQHNSWNRIQVWNKIKISLESPQLSGCTCIDKGNEQKKDKGAV